VSWDTIALPSGPAGQNILCKSFFAARWLRGGLKSTPSPEPGQHYQIVRGRPVLNSRLLPLYRKRSAHQVNDLGDSNNI
jgi:hypothetical protein